MSLSIAIVGLPNVGKSTLFNALTDSTALAANYPFATIEPNTGIVPIPDKRLQKLSEFYNNAPIKPATVTFVDIAGLVAGAHSGEGLGNQFLANIRSCDAICHVVRAFDDPNVQHVDQSAGQRNDPKNDIDVINTELVLADLQTVNNRLPRIQKEAKANPKIKPILDCIEEVKNVLEDNRPLSSQPAEWRDKNQEYLKDLQLLTMKPVIYVFNVDEQGLQDQDQKDKLSAIVAPSQALFVCAKLEDELRGLDKVDQAEMLSSYGQEESGLVQVIHTAYSILGLQSFLTAGEKEVRAWTIPSGSTAPQAAGVIHGDFERGFIAAQVTDFNDLMVAGSEAAARSAGKIRTEGKTYIMQANDVVEFRFNV